MIGSDVTLLSLPSELGDAFRMMSRRGMVFRQRLVGVGVQRFSGGEMRSFGASFSIG